MASLEVEYEDPRYAVIFRDNGGMSVLYRGCKSKCEDYLESQERRLLRGMCVRTSITIEEDYYEPQTTN
jgi:hypothetical protein